MITILIGFIIGIILGAYIVPKKQEQEQEYVYNSTAFCNPFFCGVAIAFVFTLFALMIGEQPPMKETFLVESPAHKGIFLVSQKQKNDLIYTMYYEKNGRIIEKKISSDKCTIKYIEDPDQPRLDITKSRGIRFTLWGFVCYKSRVIINVKKNSVLEKNNTER